MFTDRIENPFLIFRLFFCNLSEEKKEGIRKEPDAESIRLTKNAFLYVIENYNSYSSQKKRLLDEISSFCPKMLDELLDEEMLGVFYKFCKAMVKKNIIVSPAELDWVNFYIKGEKARIEIEESIYGLLLQTSSYWDKMRQNYNWSITEERRLEIVQEKLSSSNLGAKRKVELSEEFGESNESFKKEYFRTLLFDGHYKKAQSLGVNDPDTVMDCIVSAIEVHHFEMAREVAEKFQPELVSEVEKFISKCPPFID